MSDSGRQLTTGEIDLLTEFYGNGTNFNEIIIHNSKHNPLQASGIAMAPNGNIYFTPDDPNYRVDFAAQDVTLAQQHTFIHEMFHVVQHQNGVDLIGAGLMDMFKGFVGLKPYDYRPLLDARIPYDNWNIEAQAQYQADRFYLENYEGVGPQPSLSESDLIIVNFENLVPSRVYTSPLTFAGDAGAFIGNELAIRYAGDAIAIRLTAGAAGSAIGSTIGDILYEQYDAVFDDIDGTIGYDVTNDVSGNLVGRFSNNLVGSFAAFGASLLFNKLFDGEGYFGIAGEAVATGLATQGSQYTADIIANNVFGSDIFGNTQFYGAGTAEGFSAAGLGASLATAAAGAVAGYAGTQLALALFDGNPVGANIGGAIGGAIGGFVAGAIATSIASAVALEVGAIVLFGTAAEIAGIGFGTSLILSGTLGVVLPVIGIFIGALIGAALGGLFGGDPAEPEAVSLVELGFRLDAQGFFVVDGYVKDGGSAEAARNIGQSGADALNAFLDVVGGRAIDFNKTIGFGYVGSEYIGTGGRRFNSVQALIDAEVTNVFKEIQIEGGDLYMKRALANTTATNIAELSDDLGIAVRYGQYMDNPVLFLEDVADWEQDEWAATLLRAEEELNLDDVHASDSYERTEDFGYEISVERSYWVAYNSHVTIDQGDLAMKSSQKVNETWRSVSAHRELNINGKDILIVELGIYSDELSISRSGNTLTITVLNPTAPQGDTRDYTETFKIEDWHITWNQVDRIRFMSGQEFDVTSALTLESGENVDLTADITNVFGEIAPVFYEQTAESPGTLIEGDGAADTLTGSVGTDDTLMGDGGDDVYQFGSDSGDDLIFDTQWNEVTEDIDVNYFGRASVVKNVPEQIYTDNYDETGYVGRTIIWSGGNFIAGDVDELTTESETFTSYVEADAGTADKVLFEADVLEEHVSFSLIGNDLIVTVGNSVDDETSTLTIRDWGEEKNRIESFEFTEAGEGPISVDDVLTLLAQGGGDNSIFALDLGRNGLELVSQEDSGILFDMDNDGFKEQTGWVAATDGILVLDRNNDGEINDIGEMFSGYYDHTGLNGAAPSLGSLDTNSDGVFNSLDTEFDNVRVWTDINQDGLTDIGELKGLHRHGITEIDLEGAYGSRFMGGNEVVAYSELTQIGETTDQTGAAYGVYLDYGHGMKLTETIAGVSAGWSRFEFEDTDNVLFTNDDYNYLGESLVMTADLGGFVTGGFADDTLSVDAAETQGFMINGADGDDHITGGAGNDTLTGGDGADTLLGGDGDDLLNIDAADLATGQIDAGAGDDLILYEGDENLDLDISTYQAEGFVGGGGNDDIYTTSATDAALSGGAGDDTLTGDAGDDQLIGETGDDHLVGGVGNDVLQGGAGADVLQGGIGDDTLYIDAEDDLADIDGGTGTDTIIIEGIDGIDLDVDSVNAEIAIGGYGDDTLSTSGAAGVELYGGAGNDTLIGGAGSDLLDGNTGQDTASYVNSDAALTIDLAAGTVSGGYGTGDTLTSIENIIGSAFADDILGDDDDNRLEGGAGADTLDGGDGIDTASYAGSAAAVSIDLENATASGGDAAGDTLLNMENLIGSEFADTLTGDAGDNAIAGEGGDDLLTGGAGDDGLFGGAGADTLLGGDNDDLLEGGEGADSLDGGAGLNTLSYVASTEAVAIDLQANTASGGDAAGDTIVNFSNIIGSSYDDTLTGVDDTLSGNVLSGGGGDDLISGGTGPDTLDGGTGTDTVSFASETSAVDVSLADEQATDGNGQISELYNFEKAIGSNHDDTLTGSDGNDILEGGLGADILDGGDGADAASYETSNAAVAIDLAAGTASGGHATGDTLTNIESTIGSDYGDTLTGDDNNNEFAAGEGNDSVDGGLGEDILDGDIGDDTLHGGDNNDLILGGEGADEIYGDHGDDTLIGGIGDDLLYGGLGGDMFFGGTGVDTVYGGDGVDIVDYSAIAQIEEDEIRENTYDLNVDLVAGTAALSGYYNFTDALDHVEGIIASDGNDTLLGDEWGNIFEGRAGNDSIEGYAGDDNLSGGDGNDTLTAGEGDDTVSGGEGDDIIDGGDGDDTLEGGDGYNLITGGDGDDVLTAGSDNDVLDGGAGDDQLIGGGGDDILKGGTGNDSYFLSIGSGSDRIVEENALGNVGEDVIIQDTYSSPVRTVTGGTYVEERSAGIEDILWIGSDLDFDDLRIELIGEDLFIGIIDPRYPMQSAPDMADKVILENWTNENRRIEKLRFEDGTEIDLIDRIVVEGENSSNDSLILSEDHKLVNLSAGDDIYNVSAGSGAQVIFDDLWLEQKGADFTSHDVFHSTSGAWGEPDYIASHWSVTKKWFDTVDRQQIDAGDDVLNFTGGLSLNDLNFEFTKDGLLIGIGVLQSGQSVSELQDRVLLKNWTNDNNKIEKLQFDGGSEILISSLVSEIIGTANDDNLVGTASSDFISGGDGNDTLAGGGARDLLHGGGGNDIYRFDIGDGVDSIFDDYRDLQTHVETIKYEILVPESSTTVWATEQGELPVVTIIPAHTIIGTREVFVTEEVQIDGGADILQFGIGIAFSDLLFLLDGSNLIIGLKEGANPDAAANEVEDQIIIRNWLEEMNRVETLAFQSDADVDLFTVLLSLGVLTNNSNNAPGGSILLGSAVEDTLVGGDGADVLSGGSGNDILFGLGGADNLDGGDGYDLASYESSSTGVNIDLVAGTATGGDAEGDVLIGIESIKGSAFGDSLIGDANTSSLEGGGGADFLGGNVNEDTLLGGDGNDTLSGADGKDVLDGGLGDDSMAGGLDNDLLVGGAGSDTLDGEEGADTASYATSAAAVAVDLRAGTASGGDAAGDVLSNIENVTGSDFADTLNGDSEANLLTGGQGNDILNASTGDDIYFFNSGDGQDQISDFYEESTYTQTGQQWHPANGDTPGYYTPVYGYVLQEKEGGNDTLQLSAGITVDDLAFELIGNDLYVGVRNETDTGTTASTLLDHVQILDWTDNKNAIETIAFADGSSVDIADITAFAQGTIGDDTLDNSSSSDNLLMAGFEGNDEITSGSGDDVLLGGEGNDTLTGGDGMDVLIGGEGDDVIIGGSGGDVLQDDGGNDAAQYSGIFADYSAAEDTVSGGWTITHLSSGSDGTDGVTGIEQFEFADGVMGSNGYFTSAIEGGFINLPTDAVANGTLSGGNGQTVGDLDFSLKSGPENGTVTINEDGTYSYTPDASFNGSDSFTYRFVDENGDITIGEMTVEVFDPAVLATVQQVNTSTSQQQRYSSVAVLDDGSYVVVWNSMHSGAEIYGQRYDGQGGSLGSEFLVNTYTSGTQSYPAVAGLDDGGFVVVYAGSQDPSYGIYGQRYDSSGVAVGAEFHANTYTSNAQYEPDVTGLAGGGFVVAWYSTSQDGSSHGAYGQIYDALGNMVGTELRFNTTTSGSQNNPNLTGLAGGGFVAVWDSSGALDGSGTGVFAQLYTSIGVAVGGEFQINTYYASTQREPSVAMLQNGGFVVTWESYVQDGSSYGVFGQRFDASGQMVGAEFQANTYTTSLQRYSDVVGLTGGGFVAVWASNGQDGSSYGIFGQEYDASGAVVGTEFQVNDYTTSSQHHPSIAALTDGGFIITWTSVSGDGSSEGVFSRIYGAVDRVSIGTSGNDILIGHDGNEILEGGYGADVLEGGAGDDTISGGQGADTYQFARGDGQDVIDDAATDGATDTLVLDTGIDHDQLWFEQTGDDLLISVIGTSDQITVENWYASADNKIEGIETGDGKVADFSGVEALVSAMASFSPPGGAATDLSDPTYDPLDSVLTTNWQTGTGI